MRTELNTLGPVVAALGLLLVGCSTTRPLSPGDLAAVEKALTLLLVDETVTIDREDPHEKWFPAQQRVEQAKRMTNELHELQHSLARAGDKLPLTISFYQKHSAVGEFSKSERRLTTRRGKISKGLNVRLGQDGRDYGVSMFFMENYQYDFRLRVDPEQTARLVFHGTRWVDDFYGPPPSKPAILEIPRPSL